MDTQDIEIKPVKENEVLIVKPQRKKILFSILFVVLIGALILVILFGKDILLKLDDAVAYYNRGLAYVTKGDKQSAGADFKKVLELCGNSTLCQDAQQRLDNLELK